MSDLSDNDLGPDKSVEQLGLDIEHGERSPVVQVGLVLLWTLVVGSCIALAVLLLAVVTIG